MKNLMTIILAFTVLFSIGCAEEKKSAASDPTVSGEPFVPDAPYTPPGSGPGQGPGSNWEWGGAADLKITSLSVMADYTSRSMNDPTEIKLNLNMTKSGAAFGGTATISYVDNGIRYEGYFTAGESEDDTKQNIFFEKDGKKVWHGIFEDYFGGLVVVIDEIIDLGDGGGSEVTVNGSVWFKNFGLTYAPHPPSHCWKVSLGPYDCRAWKSGHGMNTTASVNPGDGYVKLGTFSGLNTDLAFNGQAEL